MHDHKNIEAIDNWLKVIVICQTLKYVEKKRNMSKQKYDVSHFITEQWQSWKNSPLSASDRIHFMHRH